MKHALIGFVLFGKIQFLDAKRCDFKVYLVYYSALPFQKLT